MAHSMLRATTARCRVDWCGRSRDRRRSRYPILRHMDMDASGVCAHEPRAWPVVVLWHEFMALVRVRRSAIDPHRVHALCVPGVVAPRNPPPRLAPSPWRLRRNDLGVFVPAAQGSALSAASRAVAPLGCSSGAPLGVQSTYCLLARCLCRVAALDADLAPCPGTSARVRVCLSCTCTSASDVVPPYPQPQHVAAPQCRVSDAVSFDAVAKSYACTAFRSRRRERRYRPCMVPGMSTTAGHCRCPVLGPVGLLLPRSCDLSSHAISSNRRPNISAHVTDLFCTQRRARSRVATSVAFALGRVFFSPGKYFGQRSFLCTRVSTYETVVELSLSSRYIPAGRCRCADALLRGRLGITRRECRVNSAR